MPPPTHALAPTKKPRTPRVPIKDIPDALRPWSQAVEELVSLPPIPGPKPWSDELERAAIAGTIGSCAPKLALTSIGVPPATADSWLSDEPPEAYERACRALTMRLKGGQDASEKMLLGRIQTAAQDPKHWTAAAWILERSRGYVVKQASADGPNIVVHIGTMNIRSEAGAKPRPQWSEDTIIDAVSEAIPQADPGSST